MTTAVAQPTAPQTDQEQLAAPNEQDNVSQIVSFRLGYEEYGVDIMRVQEIILNGQITKMPEVPDYICGLINLRGHVIPIVDLRMRFGMAAAENNEHTRIVVDAVDEVLRINAEQVEPSAA